MSAPRVRKCVLNSEGRFITVQRSAAEDLDERNNGVSAAGDRARRSKLIGAAATGSIESQSTRGLPGAAFPRWDHRRLPE